MTFDYHITIPPVLYISYLMLVIISTAVVGRIIFKRASEMFETIESIVIVKKYEPIEK